MTKTTLHQPTVDFLTDMGETVSNDAEATALFDGIADTLGDMLGHQSDGGAGVAHFIDRLLAASAAVRAAKH